MKLATILPALQLATTATTARADDGLTDFGRILRHHEPPVQRLRDSGSKASKVVFVEEEFEAAAEIVAEVATNVATKTGKKSGLKDLGSKVFKPSTDEISDTDKKPKASKVLRAHEAVPREAFSYNFATLPKSSKVVDVLLAQEALSYNFAALPKSSKAVDVLTTQEAFSYEFTTLSKSSKPEALRNQDAFSYIYDNKAVEYLSYNFGGSSVNSKFSEMSYGSTESFAGVASMPNFDFAHEELPLDVPTLRPTALWVRETDDSLDDDEVDRNVEESEAQVDDMPLQGEEEEQQQQPEEEQQQENDGLQLEEIPAEHDDGFGHIVFKYLNQCSGADLDITSCLTQSVIYYLTSVDVMEDGIQSRRFLQSLNEDECMPPEVDYDFLKFVVDSTNEQCEGVGYGVSDAERDATLYGFLTIFESSKCWADLCNESSSPSDLFFRILFGEAAKCAGVDITGIPPCVLNGIFSFIFSSDNEDVGKVRRVLQETSSCEQPATGDIEYFVSLVLSEAEATCDASNAQLELSDYAKAFDSFVEIFGAPTCWGAEECSNGSDDFTGNDSYLYDDDSRPTLAMDGTVCQYAPTHTVESLVTRAINLSYYYLIETKSEDEDDIIATIQAIERSFINLSCGIMQRRRSLEHDDDTQYINNSTYPIVLAVDSNPPDTVSSDYGCDVKSSDAQSCSVISGTLSLIVPEAQDPSFDAELELEAYTDVLGDMFAYIQLGYIQVNDSNLVSVQYIGQDASSLSPLQNVNAATNGDQSDSQDSGAFTSIAIGLGGSLVAMGILFAGLNKVKKNNEDPIHPDEKAVDDDSEGLQTSDLTYSNSLDDNTSDISSIASCRPEQCAVVKENVTKHFILAEEEEASWRRLGITPSVRISSSLEEVYEEDSCVEKQSI